MSISDDAPTIATAGLNAALEFALKPQAEARGALARDLGIRGIKKLTFQGEILPDGARDLRLNGRLGATVVQDCVVTGEPVTTRIDEDVARRYLADYTDPEGDEAEMPEDDTAEALPATLDLTAVMAEALALALPPWPRAAHVDPVDITVTEPGKTPLSDADLKPFAGLKNLRDSLSDTGGEDG